jgi:hypothetical protein
MWHIFQLSEHMLLISGQLVAFWSSGTLQHTTEAVLWQHALRFAPAKGAQNFAYLRIGGHLAAIERFIFERCKDPNCLHWL